jgi:hypothetical protein
MTLAASGEMSIGGSTATRSINLELVRAAGATSSLNETALRTLAGVASGTISISNFYGKSNFTVAYNSLYIGSGYTFEDVYVGGSQGNVAIRWNTDGTMSFFNADSGYTAMNNWGTPTTAGIGSSYWIRFTRTATASFGSPTAATNSTASTGWLQLNTSQEIQTNRSPGQNFFGATYTIEISSDSGGATILNTLTGIKLQLVDSNV